MLESSLFRILAYIDLNQRYDICSIIISVPLQMVGPKKVKIKFIFFNIRYLKGLCKRQK